MAEALNAMDFPPGREYIADIVSAENGLELLTPEERQLHDELMGERAPQDGDFYRNLAEEIEDQYLRKLAEDVIDWVDTDEASREEWEEREKKAIRMLGVSSKTVGGADFKGASKVVHPTLIEACIQFNARALSELWPSEGPVNTQVMGEITDAKEAQSERVKGFMNYQYTKDMPGAFDEHDRLLFRLPLSGSCFKEISIDPLTGKPHSIYIEPSRMIVPYASTSLKTAIRYTKTYLESGNDTRKKIASGWYREVRIQELSSTEEIHTDVEQEIDYTQGQQYLEYDGDHFYPRYEMSVNLDIPGLEDTDDSGKPTKIALPYTVIIDKDQQQVLSIRRQWREDDPLRERRVKHVHYRFLPGLGFYGYGFLHVIGGLSEAATGSLRSLLDAAGLANLKGGFRSRDAKIVGGDRPIGMGEWAETEASPEEMKNAFFQLPYGEPSGTMFELLGFLDEVGRRVSSTTESVVGDAKNTGPVGTTVALIEQGLKVFTGIHRRIHEAQSLEFSLVADLNNEHLPEEYPYDVPGESRMIFAADFDERVDVIPVSDPNIVSNTQRIATNQAVMDLSERSPDIYDKREVHKSMLRSLRVQNVDELLPEAEVPRLDPVAENMAIMTGSPIQVFPDQDHEAHNIVHETWWDTIPEEQRELLAGSYSAHVAEHRAQAYRQHMENLIGAALPQGEIPAEVDAQISQAAAEVAHVYAQEAPQAQPGLPDEDRRDEANRREIMRKDAKTMADIENDRLKTEADIENKAMKELIEGQREAQRTQAALGLVEQNIPVNPEQI